MRSRELRLERSFRSIVVSVLAAPVAAGVMGCKTAESFDDGGAADATLAPPSHDAAMTDARGDADAASVSDADGLADAADARARVDAEVDAEACNAQSIDDDLFEGGTQDGCVDYGFLPCGLPSTAQTEGCLVDLKTCVSLARPIDASFFLYCQLGPTSCNEGGLLDAASFVEFIGCNGITGRRPLGLVASRLQRRGPIGDYFASMTHLEAASVRAFGDLARWLEHHGSPRRLVRSARRSAGDERRHTRAARRLAQRFGGMPTRPRHRRVPTPTLVALLEDDAVEGCVHETFGALVATWQASHAADAYVRRTMRRIAADETRHAALAWEILVWGVAQLPARDRDRVLSRLERALSALESRGPARIHPVTRALVGHPEPDRELLLLRAFTRFVREEALRVRRPV